MPKPKKKAVLADAVSFAHLLPAVTQASARADDSDDEDQDKDRGGAEDEDQDQNDKKPAGKKAKKAKADDDGDDDDDDDNDADADEGDDDGADAEDGDDDDKDEKKPTGKKAKADNGNDGKDDDEDEASANAGAMRERARCAAIFASKHAAGRPDLAAHLAFSTNMSAVEAIGTMKTLVGGQKVGARASLAERMRAETVPNPGQGGSDAPTGAKGLAAAMIAASQKAHGKAA